MNTSPIALLADQVEPLAKRSNYPEPFASRMVGRTKRKLGDVFGLKNFGVNQTVLKPGAVSALRHSHTRQDEFIYVLSGSPTLYTDAGATVLRPGMCAGFPSGTGNARRLANESAGEVVYLEVGDRTQDDVVAYPDDDLAATLVDSAWVFTHKGGEPY